MNCVKYSAFVDNRYAVVYRLDDQNELDFEGLYRLKYGWVGMPSDFENTVYGLDALETSMRKFEPDLRK